MAKIVLVNESIKNLLKPKSKEDIIKDAGNMDPNKLLIRSSEKGFIKGIKLALEKGADVHTNNDIPLVYASHYGHTEAVKVLLDNGADVHTHNNTALRYASSAGHTEVVKLLLDHGADVHARNNEALRWASKYGHTEVVKLLLDHGADVHAKDDYALKFAEKEGHTEVVKLLKKYMSSSKLNEVYYDPYFEDYIDVHKNIPSFVRGEYKRVIKYIINYMKNKLLAEDWEIYDKVGRIIQFPELEHDVKIPQYLKDELIQMIEVIKDDLVVYDIDDFEIEQYLLNVFIKILEHEALSY